MIEGVSFQSPAASGSRTGVDSEVPLVNSKLVPGGVPAPGERNGLAMPSKDSGEGGHLCGFFHQSQMRIIRPSHKPYRHCVEPIFGSVRPIEKCRIRFSLKASADSGRGLSPQLISQSHVFTDKKFKCSSILNTRDAISPQVRNIFRITLTMFSIRLFCVLLSIVSAQPNFTDPGQYPPLLALPTSDECILNVITSAAIFTNCSSTNWVCACTQDWGAVFGSSVSQACPDIVADLPTATTLFLDFCEQLPTPTSITSSTSSICTLHPRMSQTDL